jgi:hypothetical protein
MSTLRVALIALLLVILAACGGGQDEPTVTPMSATPTAVAQVAPSPTPVPPTATSTVAPTPTPTPTPPPVATAPPRALPTATPRVIVPPTPAPDVDERLPIVESGWSVEAQFEELGWGIVVENPDMGQAVIDSDYEVTVYDRAGQIVASGSGYIDYVLPGQRLGVGGYIYLEAGTEVADVEFAVVSGGLGTPELSPTLSVSNEAYFSTDYLASVTALIHSDSETPLESLSVWSLLRNEAGEIVGGGWGYVPFILPGEPAAVSAYVVSEEPPATVEVYPAVTSLTVWADEDARPAFEGVQPAVLVESGYSLNTFDEVSWGALIENPNPQHTITGLVADVTLFDADGAVLTRSSSFLGYILPGARVGMGGSVYSSFGAPARAEVRILGRVIRETTVSPDLLTVGDAAYVTDTLPAITGTLRNGTDRDISSARVTAVTYNADGAITGGANDLIFDIPAGGQVPVELLITLPEPPARIDLFVTASDLTDLE